MGTEKKEKDLSPLEIPWPKELSSGLGPGLLWAGSIFVLMLWDWRLAVLSAAGMLFFFHSQRHSPVGRARRHYVQGRLAYRRGNIQSALADFRQVLEIMPQAGAIYPVVGDIYFRLGDIGKARKTYRQYFHLRGNDHQTRIWYAGKLMEHALFAEAAEELKKLPDKVKSDLQVVNLLAVSLLKTKDSKGALAVLERAEVTMDGTSEHQLAARYLLGRAYLSAGEKEKAKATLRRLEQDSPGYEDTPRLLARL